MAANIQQVRYAQPSNRTSPWEAGIQGGLSGMSGYYGRQQQKQDNLMKLLPVFAQMKMLKQGGKAGAPGVINVPGAGPFTVSAPRQGSQDKYYDAKTQETLMENGVLPWTPAFARRKAISDVDKEYIKDPTLKLNKGWQTDRDAAVSARTKAYLSANSGGGGDGKEIIKVYPKDGGKAFVMPLKEFLSDPESTRKQFNYELMLQDDVTGVLLEVDGVKIDGGTNEPVGDESLPLSVLALGGVAGVEGVQHLAKKGAKKLTAEAVKQGWSKYGAKGALKFPFVKKALAGVSQYASQYAPALSKATPWALPAYIAGQIPAKGITGKSQNVTGALGDVYNDLMNRFQGGPIDPNNPFSQPSPTGRPGLEQQLPWRGGVI